MILANKEENRERNVLALAAAGLSVFVSDPRTVAHAIVMLGKLAHITGAADAAQPWLAAMRASKKSASASRLGLTRVLMPFWRDPWMAVGADTYAHDLLRICGGVNVAAELPGHFPGFELAQLEQMRPDLILLPSKPYAFAHGDAEMLHSVFGGPIWRVDGKLLT